MRVLLMGVAASLWMVGCEDKKDTSEAAAASASVASAAPSASAPAPSASASAAADVPEPHHDCPANSTGIGSFNKPCEATGKERMMTVKVTKIDDKGPNFNIKNVGKLTILYGKIALYYYDKDGKQLQVSDESETPAVMRDFRTCSGNIFQGVMKPGESASLTFSCTPKSGIPANATTIEAEMQMVGFADDSGKKNDFYWRNKDLTPDKRPKGGIK